MRARWSGSPLRLTVLGPERPDPQLPTVLDRLGARGPLALVSAGWRYDEDRDEPLVAAVGRTVHNLRLYQAWQDLERDAPELAAAWARKQALLKGVKERYRVVLRHALAVAQELWSPRGSDAWYSLGVRALREADEAFLAEADRLHADFADQVRPDRHPLVRAVQARISDVLAGCDTVLVAGGHVGVLRNRMSFFGLDRMLRHHRVVAWSGGAMVLTDRVLLYHDHTPSGHGAAELLDRGLGLVSGVIYLPHARMRLDLADQRNLAILAARLAPAELITLENGAVLAGGRAPVGVAGTAGRVDRMGLHRPLEAGDATGS